MQMGMRLKRIRISLTEFRSFCWPVRITRRSPLTPFCASLFPQSSRPAYLEQKRLVLVPRKPRASESAKQPKM